MGTSELLQLVDINLKYINGILIFILEIPLFSNYDFILYKSIPLPTKVHDNLYTIIQTNTEYITVDKSRSYYIELKNYQLLKYKTNTNNILCKHDQPLQYVKES